MSYRTSDIAPIVDITVAVLVLVLVLVAVHVHKIVAAIAVLGFIAALLLAALVLGFNTTTAAAVTASALVTAAAPAALDTTTGLEVQVDMPGAAGVAVEGLVIIHRLIFQFPWIKAVCLQQKLYRGNWMSGLQILCPKSTKLGGDLGWSKIMELFSISMVNPRHSSANARDRKHSPPNTKVS